MNAGPIILISSLACLASFSCRTKTYLPDDVKKDMPAEESTAPQRKPNTGADPSASGTRSDYKPTTGPAGQQESDPQAPPASTNPAPSNPNTPPPPPPDKKSDR